MVEWRKKVEHRARQEKKTSGKLHRILESDKSGRLICLSCGCDIGGCCDVVHVYVVSNLKNANEFEVCFDKYTIISTHTIPARGQIITMQLQ